MIDRILSMHDYLLLYLYYSKEREKIPSIRFWALTGIVVGAGVQIAVKMEECDDEHILTQEDCFNEMNDLINEKGGWL